MSHVPLQFLATVFILVAGCGRREETAAEASLQRELGKAYFEEGRFQSAARAFQSVLVGSKATAQDLVNAAACEVAQADGDLDRAKELLHRAATLDPGQPAVPYLSGIIAQRREAWSDALL